MATRYKMIRTKIIATMGPAVATVESLYSLFEAGVDICRLNFSHGDLSTHADLLKIIREAASRFEHPIAVLGDLCGPKIRLGKIADVNGTGGMPVAVGDEVVIQRKEIVGENLRISTILESFVDDVKVGDRVLIEDGMLRFVVTDKTSSEVRVRCMVGGIIKSSKGINLPNTVINVPSITDRDWECVDWAIQNDLDYLALSFVRRAKDIELLRGHLQYKKAPDIALIAKIEKAEALTEMDAIIEAADGLMVARGDLGVEMDVAQVPIIQKDIIHRCQKAGKPVIVATQMLQSMIEQATPTRAEISDVANAILDGTDALMLSAETSVGKFPVVAVHTMAHTAEVTEDFQDKNLPETADPPRLSRRGDPSAALARAAWRTVNDLDAKLVVIWSQSGMTARVFSKHHFHCPLIAISSDQRVLRRMAIHYGVVPQLMERPESTAEMFERIDKMLIARKYAQEGDRIIIVAGWSPTTPDTMNGIIVHSVGDKWAPISPTGSSVNREGK
ncbi:MAG: pyruvate kinase [Burkholderiales bacterium]|nr:pyruvate kinase [Phycisphaerae bacterium]